MDSRLSGSGGHTSCEEFYQQQGEKEKPRVLIAMALGQKSFPQYLRKTLLTGVNEHIVPRKKQLKREADQRYKLQNLKSQGIKKALDTWKHNEIVLWLELYPRQEQADIEFIERYLRTTSFGLDTAKANNCPQMESTQPDNVTTTEDESWPATSHLGRDISTKPTTPERPYRTDECGEENQVVRTTLDFRSSLCTTANSATIHSSIYDHQNNINPTLQKMIDRCDEIQQWLGRTVIHVLLEKLERLLRCENSTVEQFFSDWLKERDDLEAKKRLEAMDIPEVPPQGEDDDRLPVRNTMGDEDIALFLDDRFEEDDVSQYTGLTANSSQQKRLRGGGMEGLEIAVRHELDVADNESGITSIDDDVIQRCEFADGGYYEGMLVKDKYNGTGKRVWPDGASYDGEWKDGKPHGIGRYRFPNGDSYKGQYQNGVKEGQGLFTWTDGGYYEGSFVCGKREGEGTRVLVDGEEYQGLWKNDIPNGEGKWKHPKGYTYEGSYCQGLREGQGHFFFPDGGDYSGSFLNNMFNGFGERMWADGTYYRGEWKDDKPHGKGRHSKPDGESYDGEWKDGKRHGQGKTRWPSGNIYEGEHWKGFCTGQGRSTFADSQACDSHLDKSNLQPAPQHERHKEREALFELRSDMSHGEGAAMSLPEHTQRTKQSSDLEADSRCPKPDEGDGTVVSVAESTMPPRATEGRGGNRSTDRESLLTSRQFKGTEVPQRVQSLNRDLHASKEKRKGRDESQHKVELLTAEAWAGRLKDLTHQEILARALGLPGCDFRKEPFYYFDKLTKQMLLTECRRRTRVIKGPMFPNIAWTKMQLVRWLIRHTSHTNDEANELKKRVHELQLEWALKEEHTLEEDTLVREGTIQKNEPPHNMEFSGMDTPAELPTQAIGVDPGNVACLPDAAAFHNGSSSTSQGPPYNGTSEASSKLSDTLPKIRAIGLPGCDIFLPLDKQNDGPSVSNSDTELDIDKARCSVLSLKKMDVICGRSHGEGPSASSSDTELDIDKATCSGLSLRKMDVIWGRSNALTEMHLGNRRFRRIIGLYRASYQSTLSRRMKTIIAKEVLDRIKSRGRFVRKSQLGYGKTYWVPVEDNGDEEMVRKALRRRRHMPPPSPTRRKPPPSPTRRKRKWLSGEGEDGPPDKRAGTVESGVPNSDAICSVQRNHDVVGNQVFVDVNVDGVVQEDNLDVGGNQVVVDVNVDGVVQEDNLDSSITPLEDLDEKNRAPEVEQDTRTRESSVNDIPLSVPLTHWTM